MYSDDMEYDRAGLFGASLHRIWRAYGGYSAFLDVDTFVKSWARNTIDYTGDDYNGRFYDLDVGGYDNYCDSEDSGYSSNYYRYEVYETTDVSDWNYPVGTCKPLAKHEFYACDYWRTLEVEFCTQYIE